MIEKRSLTTLIVIILILFLVYLVMKSRTAKIKKRMDDERRFGRRK